MSSSKILVVGFASIGLGVAAMMLMKKSERPAEVENHGVPVLRSAPEQPVAMATRRDGFRKQPGEEALPDAMRRDFDLQEKGYRAAKPDMTDALKILGEIELVADRESFMRGVFTRASTWSVWEALDAVRKISLSSGREPAMLTLACRWSGKSVVQVMEGATPEVGRVAGVLGLQLLGSKRLTPEETVAYSREFVRGPGMASLIAEAAVAMVKTDPARAFAFGDSLSGDEQMRFLKNFARGWATMDPQAVWRWAGQNPDGEIRSALQKSALAPLGDADPATAAVYLAEMNLRGDERASALEDLGGSWANKDSRAALQWAESFTDETDRAAAKKGVRKVIPAGVGVGLGAITENGAIVNSIIPGGAASQSGGLAEGDSILSVRDAAGNWLSPGDLDPQEFIEHVRGEPGTPVSLQVRGKDGGATKIVTLTRQLLPVQKEP